MKKLQIFHNVFNLCFSLLNSKQNLTDILRKSIIAGNDSNEIDDHLKIFGKHAVDVDYTLFGYCNFCNTRIDEFGFCACSGGAAD